MQLAQMGGSLAYISISVGIAGFLFGFYQYIRNQRWKRAQAAAELLDRFFQDEEVRIALRLISWHQRKFSLPRNFFKTATFDNNDGEIDHSIEKLARAFDLGNRVHYRISNTTDLKSEFLNTDIPIYVEIFDEFFERLSRTLHFIKCYDLEARDLEPLVYLIRRIDQIEYNGKKIFNAYLRYYEYEDILKVLDDPRILKQFPLDSDIEQV